MEICEKLLQTGEQNGKVQLPLTCVRLLVPALYFGKAGGMLVVEAPAPRIMQPAGTDQVSNSICCLCAAELAKSFVWSGAGGSHLPNPLHKSGWPLGLEPSHADY